MGSTSSRRPTPSTRRRSSASSKCSAQRARRSGRVVSLPAPHGPDDGDARRSGSGECADVGRGDPSDRDHGEPGRREPCQRREPLGSERGPGVRLVAGSEAGTHAPVVRGPGAHPCGFGGRAHRDAQDEAVGQMGPQAIERRGVLTQVGTPPPRGERGVHPIVDDHRDAPRPDPRPGDPPAVARAPGGERIPACRGGGRDLPVLARSPRRVPGAGRAPAGLARRAAARHRRGRRARWPAALHPRAAALLHSQTAARAETYVPARRGQAAAGPARAVTTATASRSVVVSAKGAARWQGGHPWIYRTDLYDEPREDVVAGIRRALAPEGILLRNDAPIRRREALPLEVVPAFGGVPDTLAVEEHGIRYLAAPHTGQKTGAFLDQRENRVLVAEQSGAGRALDLFTYHGSFALHLARRAREVIAVDSSAAFSSSPVRAPPRIPPSSSTCRRPAT